MILLLRPERSARSAALPSVASLSPVLMELTSVLMELTWTLIPRLPSLTSILGKKEISLHLRLEMLPHYVSMILLLSTM